MNVLCVMAHPDDEVLGCGGTLAKHAEAGDDIRFVFGTFRDMGQDVHRAIAALLGREVAAGHLNLRDQRFEGAYVAQKAEWLAESDHGADIIYTHHPDDLNIDHQFIARAVLTAFRPKPGEKPRTILACEVGSSTEWTFPQVFQPNWFEKISPDHLYKSQQALACYPSEVEEWPHPRSNAGLAIRAAWRGQQSGSLYAEAFQLLRRSC